jgi:hypothetical protein
VITHCSKTLKSLSLKSILVEKKRFALKGPLFLFFSSLSLSLSEYMRESCEGRERERERERERRERERNCSLWWPWFV